MPKLKLGLRITLVYAQAKAWAYVRYPVFVGPSFSSGKRLR